MSDPPRGTPEEKPLAGSCPHQWQNQKGPYLLSQLCPLCKLFRYKIGATADWEYRAPIPIASQFGESQGKKT